MSLAHISAGVIIVGKGVDIWAIILDSLGVRVDGASVGSIVSASAAVFVSTECRAGRLASNEFAIFVLLEIIRAVGKLAALGGTASIFGVTSTVTVARDGMNGNRQVVAIDKGDIVVVETTATLECELCQGSRVGSTSDSARLAVAGFTSPETSLPIGCEGEGFGGSLLDINGFTSALAVSDVANLEIRRALVLDNNADAVVSGSSKSQTSKGSKGEELE